MTVMLVVKELAVGTIEWPGYRCERCSHEWPARYKDAALPTVCPKCKNPYWNKLKRAAKSKATPEAHDADK
jgi:hypothetical protein